MHWSYKRLLHCLIFICIVLSNVSAQKSDYVWLSGYDSNARGDSAMNGFQFGNVKMDFNYNPVKVNYDSLGMNFLCTDITLSDSEGSLLLYSNGIYVANAEDELITNGDSINTGYVIDVLNPELAQLGLKVPQGMIALPDVANPNRYYLFYSFLDTLPGSNTNLVYWDKILVTLIDMSGNGGLGSVVYKNLPIIVDTLAGEIQAVRHGNGRDWWILSQKRNSNCYYRMLLDSLGPHLMPDLSCLGTITQWDDVGATCFSPDGSKYVYLAGYTGLSIYDFDRCSGVPSNARNLPLPVIVDSTWISLGVAISPNNRFLYASITHQLYQFDLLSSDIFSTIDTVGIYNGGHLPGTPGIENCFDIEQLAPDGKIYMSCGNPTNVLHIISDPDSARIACNFIQGGIVLPALADCVPNYPNYRLGSLTQSQCDTLANLTEIQREAKEQIIKVYPNPARDYANIDYGFTDWNKGQPNLEICDVLGTVVYRQTLPMYSGFQKIDVAHFSAGVYTVYIKRNAGVIAKQKFVKD